MMLTFGSHDAKMMLKKMLNHKMDESLKFLGQNFAVAEKFGFLLE